VTREIHVELAPSPAEVVVCSCTDVPIVPGAPAASALLAAWVREQIGPGAEVCANADGSVSFAREPWGAENGGTHQAVSAPAWEGWSEKPPVGTEALLGCGFVEIHVGRWIWQTVSASGA